MSDLTRLMLIGAAAGIVFAPSMLLAGGATRAVKTYTVEITGFKFVPAILSVRTGDKIRWVNRDIAPHTASAKDESWDTGMLEKDASIITVVGETIAEEYYCRFHPHMTARLKLVTK